MAVTQGREPGIKGFYGRAANLDALITSSLERKNQLDKYKTDTAAATDIATNLAANQTNLATNQATITARGQEAALGRQTTLEQEKMQQTGQTARQKLSEAGNLALENLRNKSALDRVEAAGEQSRKTKKTLSGADDLALELLKNTGKKAGYQYKQKPGLAIEDTVDIEDYLDIE